MKTSQLFISVLALVLLHSQQLLADFNDEIRPLLAKYCVDCHGSGEQHARIRLDQLSEFRYADMQLWTQVYQAIAVGEMPPDDGDQLKSSETKLLLHWIKTEAKNSFASNTPKQRRLNRREYSNALQDLTGLPIDFAAGLAADGKVDGFDTGAKGLQDAADSVAQLLETSRRAVASIRFLEPETDSKLQVNFRDFEFTDFRKFVK